MLEAIRDYMERTGRIVGFKAAGGVLDEQGGAAPAGAGQGDARRRVADPRALRIGASVVLNDLLIQYAKTETGRYGRSEDFSRE